MDDIFNINDIADLPPELVKELKLASDIDTTLLELFFQAGGKLDLSTLLVGYYRKHMEIRTRQYMMTTCYRLVKKGFLEPTDSKGEYSITEKGRAVINADSKAINKNVDEELNNEQKEEVRAEENLQDWF